MSELSQEEVSINILSFLIVTQRIQSLLPFLSYLFLLFFSFSFRFYFMIRWLMTGVSVLTYHKCWLISKISFVRQIVNFKYYQKIEASNNYITNTLQM